MFDKVTWAGIRQGITAAITLKIVAFGAPPLFAVAVFVTGFLDHSVEMPYLLAASFIVLMVGFGGAMAGLNHFAAWDQRLRDSESIFASDTAHRLIKTDGRHQNKIALLVNVPIQNMLPRTQFYSIVKCDITMWAGDKRNPRKNLDMAGPTDGRMLPFQPLNPQVPAVIIEDLMQEPRMEGELEFQIKFGRSENKKKHALAYKRKIVGVRQGDGNWSFQFLGL